jgi:16S rRNA G527 N7-methylase RsmG
MTLEPQIDREKNRAAFLRAFVQLIDEHCQSDEKRVKAFEEYIGIDFATYRGGAEHASLSRLQQERLIEITAEIMREKHAARRKPAGD